MTKREKSLSLVIIILLILLGFAVSRFYGVIKTNKELQDLNRVANQEIETWKGKDGLNRAKIEVLQTRDTETFLAFQSQDSTLKQLQSEVKEMSKFLKKQGSVTIIKTETKYDTIYENSNKIYDDIFNSFIMDTIDNDWISTSFGFKLDSLPDGRFRIDSTKFTLTTRDAVSLTLGLEPTGFLGLGKGKPFAQVKNLNPYSSTTDMKTYQVSPIDPKRFGLGAFTGITLDSGFQVKPVIGLGLTYSLIQFKL